MQIRYPLEVGSDGRLASSPRPAHVREMIEQVLFTAPGERVNRPEFGCGVMELVYGPNSETLAAATQALIVNALQRWLGDHIRVETVTVRPRDARLEIEVRYTLIRTQETTVERFQVDRRR